MRRCNIGGTRKRAAAIAYTPDEPAPRIIAAGRDRDAERIIMIAKNAGIEIVEEPALAAFLEAGKAGDYIPPWCWEAVAKILAFVISKEKG